MSDSEIITGLIHEGKGFSVADVFDIAIAGVETFVGIPDAVHVHFHDMAVDASAGPLLIEFLESPTVTVAGTPVVPLNRRRDSSNTARMRVYGGATVTGGMVMYPKKMYGSSNGVNSEAKEGLIRGEWVLDPDKTYAVRITNQSGVLVSVSVDMDFYEDEI